MKIKVTQQHIDDGVRSSACRCPITRATYDALGLKFGFESTILTSPLRISILKEDDRGAKFVHYPLPPEAQSWLKQYDNSPGPSLRGVRPSQTTPGPIEFEVFEEG